MRETLLALADRSASVTPKSQVVHEQGGFANAMPAAWPERGLLGVKWVTVTPSNRERGQARSHARVIEARGRGPLTVWGRRPAALEELAAWCAAHTPDLELRTTTDRAAALAGAGVVISGLPIGLHGHAVSPAEVAPDATLLPLDYASVAGAGIARTGTLVADDPVQFEALRPVKLGEDYPSATGATGDLLRDGRPSGLVVAQNLGSGLGDVVLADAVVRAAG